MEKIKNIMIKPGNSVKQALKKMDETGKRVLFVVDGYNTILGIITDGDIRRWILKGETLNKKTTEVMNKNPILLKEGFSTSEARELMLSNQIECLPIVDNTMRVISALWWMELFDSRFNGHKIIDIPAVIMAGGEGSRLLPFTNILPKPLIPIGEKPIIELIMDKFAEQGCRDFYVSVNYKSDIVKAYLNDRANGYNIRYIKEEKPLGTIGSLYMLKDTMKSAFFVVNCDIFIEADYSDIIKFHRDSKNKITLVVSMKHYTIPYGICEIKDGGILKGINEKPEYDYLVNTGFYIMENEVLNDIPEDFYNMTDLIDKYIKKDKKVGVYPVSDKSWLDIGELQELQKTLKKFNIK